MTKPRSFYWLSSALLLAALAGRAPAQSGWTNDPLEKKLNRSHLLDLTRFGPPAGNTEELFRQRLKTIHTREISEALRKKYSQTPEQLDQLVRRDPELVERYLKNFKIDDLPADLRKRLAGSESELEEFIHNMTLGDFLKSAREAQGLNPAPDAGGLQPGGSSPTPSSRSADEPAPSSQSGASPEGEGMAPESPSSPASSEEPQANSALGRFLLQAAERIKDLDPSLHNSPVLRRAIRELSRKIDRVDERWKQLDRGADALAEKWARLGQVLPLERLWPEKGFSWPRSRTPPALPKLPSAPSQFGRTALPRAVQRVPFPSAPSDGWRILGMLTLLAALALVLWKVLQQVHGGGLDRGARVWKLGPWPVQPGSVHTRQELIQAFEYLSVLRLGPAARSWHHWAIALGLGQSANETGTSKGRNGCRAERRRAAEELASLYEQARYAPPGETLAEAALATARRDLCLLAGVPIS